MESMNASHAINLFRNSCHHISTNGKAPPNLHKIQQYPQSLYSPQQRATLETWPFQYFHVSLSHRPSTTLSLEIRNLFTLYGRSQKIKFIEVKVDESVRISEVNFLWKLVDEEEISVCFPY